MCSSIGWFPLLFPFELQVPFLPPSLFRCPLLYPRTSFLRSPPHYNYSISCALTKSKSMSFLESAAMATARRAAAAALPSIEQLTLRSVHRAGLPRSASHVRNLLLMQPSTRSRWLQAQARVSRNTTRSFIKPAENTPKHAQEPRLTPKTARGASKVFKSADEAVADITSGSTILSAGFGLCGTAGENCPKSSNHNLH
jgi:hypothetical protein